MGQSLQKSKSKPFPDLLEETQIFSLWTIDDVRELRKRFLTQVNGFALVEAQFETIISFKKDIVKFVPLEELFNVLDNDHDGRLDGLELLGGLALCCQATFEEKAQFCFELYDFNLNSSLSKKEMIMMMISSICGMISLTGGDEDAEPELEVFEALADEAFLRADRDNSGNIAYGEFVQWARSNRDLMAVLDSLGKSASKAKLNINPEDSAEEADEAYLSPSDIISLEPSITRRKSDKLNKSEQEKIFSLMEIDAQWTGQIWEPTFFKPLPNLKAAPDTNIQLLHAFGYRCQFSRNNLRYAFADGESKDDPTLIVYTTAALGVVYNTKSKCQRFYEGHGAEITCLAMHPSGQLVATGDAESSVHLWNASKLQCVRIINLMVKCGVEFLALSPGGDRIATVGCDAEHTLALYDLLSTGDIISSAKGLSIPNKVFDIAYAPNGTEIVMVGQNQVKFYLGVHTEQRAIRSELGRIGKIGKKQSFFCVTYLDGPDSACVVGCASGELYKFKGHCCIQVVQAHGVQEPVFSIFYGSSVIVTGSKDATIKTFDTSLGEVGFPLDMSEDLDGDGKADNGSLDSSVISIQFCGSNFLIGTRGGDIFEAKLPIGPQDPYILNRIAWSHCGESITSLAAHPTMDVFTTAGSDKTLRVWNIRKKTQANIRKLPEIPTAITYSPMGNIMAVGMIDGTVALIEADQSFLRVYFSWKHCSKTITDIKFSPNSEFVAVASRDCNIYIYAALGTDKKKYKRLAVCKGHMGAVTHIDFSTNSKYIQSNGEDLAVLYWDLTGSEIKQEKVIRDIIWSNMSCVFAWAAKGIWPPHCNYTEVNCQSTLSDLGVIATGDNYNRVNIFRYPSLVSGSLFQSYVGHSSGVNGVQFSYNRRHLISVGGKDKTILIWSHELETEEASDDDVFSVASSGSSKSGNSSFAGDQAPPPTGGDNADDDDDMFDEDKKQIVAGVLPWKSAVVEPSAATHKEESTDCDFDLKWVHGYRCNNVVNNVFYSARSDIVYHAARVCIVYNRNTETQRFLMGAHSDDVFGLTGHPNGNIFASSDQSTHPTIIVWDSTEMKVLRRLQNAHKAAVTLLAFNSKGHLLASIGQDENNTLVVHNHENGAEIMRTPVSKRRVSCLTFLFRKEKIERFNQSQPQAPAGKPSLSRGGPVTAALTPPPATPAISDDCEVVATGGFKGIMFWQFNGQNCKSQKGLWGKVKKSNVYAIASATENMCVSTHGDGSLVLWENMKATYVTRPSLINKELPHFTKVRAIWAIHGEPIYLIPGTNSINAERHRDLNDLKTCARYVTGDERGIIAIWCLVVYDIVNDKEMYGLHCISSFSSEKLSATKTASPIRSLCARDGSLLIGLASCEIVQVKEADIEYFSPTVLEYIDEVKRRRRGTRSTGLSSRGGEGYNKPLQLNSIPPISETTPHLPTTPGLLTRPVIYQRSITGELLVSGHSGEGELCALAMMPKREYYFTAGDDCALRCWTYDDTNEPISFAFVPNKMAPVKCRAMDIHPDDSIGHLAIGFTNGKVYIVLINDFFIEKGLKKEVTEVIPQIYKLDSLHSAIKCIKYSFDGSFLAISTLDGAVCLYKFSDRKDVGKYELKRKFQALTTGSISCIDFGVKQIHTEVDLPVSCLSNDTVSARGVKMKEVKHVYTTVTTVSHFLPETMQIETHVSRISKVFHVEDEIETLEGVTHEEDKPDIRPVTFNDYCMQIASQDVLALKFYMIGKIINMDLPAAVVADGKSLLASKTMQIPDTSESPSSVKDAWWATWSCPFGWPVQGIWPALDDGTSVAAVARANNWETVPVISAVDDVGRVRLLTYPSVIPGSPDKCYRGHSKRISNIKFAPSDSICVTIGGFDRCVFVWGTDICDAVREIYASMGAKKDAKSKKDQLFDADIVFDESESFEEELEGIIMMQQQGLLHDTARGGSSSRSHPWRRLVREPSDWVDNDSLANTPERSLELKYVYGYHGWDCTNNIGFTENSSCVVYHIAAVGIVLNQDNGTQIFNTEHDGEICCLSVHPDGHSIVSGDKGDVPKIVVWDANTGVTISVIKYHTRGVSAVAFSRSGKLVISVGMDVERRVAVHNHRTGALLGSGKAGAIAEIRALTVCGDECFLTAGKHHMTFWTLPSPTHPGGPLQSRNAIFKHENISKIICSACYMGVDAVTGLADGHVVLWKDRTSHKISGNGHIPGANVNAIVSNGSIIISGATDGKIIIWNLQLLATLTIDLNSSTPVPLVAAQIQALALKDDRLLIGTKASEIYDISILNPTHQCSRIVEGHCNDMESGSIGACTGVAMHPRQVAKFVTCGEDRTVRTWNLKNDTPLPAPRHLTSMPSPAVAVAFDPEGSEIAVATVDGTVHFLPSSDFKTPKSVVAVTTLPIKFVQYSPDGNTLAVGTALGPIVLVDVISSSCRAQLIGHSGGITGIDFSNNSRYLQSTSESFEILFWSAVTGEQLQSGSEARDLVWATNTCTVGWAMQGLWSDDDKEVVVAATNQDKSLLCISDDHHRVSLFQFPLPMERVQGRHYKGHSSNVSSIRFSVDSKYVLTTGGLDKAIMKWAVLKKS